MVRAVAWTTAARACGEVGEVIFGLAAEDPVVLADPHAMRQPTVRASATSVPVTDFRDDLTATVLGVAAVYGSNRTDTPQ
jgi:hypothetical protein